jgi:hypothetical protein
MTTFGGFSGLAVDAWARQATRVRAAGGSYVDGKWVATGPTSETIRAAIQAPSAADLSQLPEGERTEAHVTVWSRSDLRTADEDAGTEADIITGEDGRSYKIVRLANRSEGAFYRAMARLISDGRGRRV